MPSNPQKCCNIVKNYFCLHHKKCRRDRPSVKKSGFFLNKCFKNMNPFENRKMYTVCYGLSLRIEASDGAFVEWIEPKIGEEKNKQVADEKIQQFEQNDGVSMSRSDRLERRNRVKNGKVDLKKLNTVKVKVGGCVESEGIDYKNKRKSQKNVLIDDIIQMSDNYYKPFHRLCWRKRMNRMDYVAKEIIAMCVDKKDLKDKRLTYLSKNVDLLNDALNIVFGLKEKIKGMLQLQEHSIQLPIPCDYISDKEEEEEEIEGEIIPQLEDQDDLTKLGNSILSECSGQAYERIRKNIRTHAKKNLPSNYMLNKLLPLQIECVSFDCSKSSSQMEQEVEIEEAIVAGKKVEIKGEQDLISFLSPSFIQLKGEDDMQSNTSIKNNVIGASLKGSFNNIIQLMIKKHNKDSRTKIDKNEQMILLTSIDGAEAVRTNSDSKGVISFSSQLFTPKHISNGVVTSGNSKNILTWMQIMGKEEFPVVYQGAHSFLEGIIKWKENEQRKNEQKDDLHVYNVHDVKMLYNMLQHSQWNRKFHPFLLCSCKSRSTFARMDDNDNSEGHHFCKMITDKKYLEQWNRSKTRWDKKTKNARQIYTHKSHRDWCDKNNLGITHLGCNPHEFPPSSIRFDVMHMKAAITRRFMNYLRSFILKQSSQKVRAFCSNVLTTFWGRYHVYCWTNKYSFSKFQGKELNCFVNNNKAIIDFLKKSFILTEDIESYIEALGILPRVFKFLSTTYIKNKESYKSQLKQFHCDVKAIYKCGRHTYLRDDEPFYFHCMRFYMPVIAEETYQKHQLGVGVFNMQGFERRNKESKTFLFNYSNNRNEKLLNNNMKRLLQLYWNNNSIVN